MLKKFTNLASIDVKNQFCCWFSMGVVFFNMTLYMSADGRQYRSNIDTGNINNRRGSNSMRLTPDRSLNFATDSAMVESMERNRRSVEQQYNDNSFIMAQECYQRYTNTDHHHSLVNWLNHKNASHYSPISPSYHQALLKLQTEELIHGLQVTSGASACSSRKMRVISSSTPLRERAVCQFEYILNYKPNRIPSTFTEVKCSCPRPSGNIIGKRMFECEPLRYQVRVLLFDEQCLSFTEHTETIALACIPVLQANVNADDRADVIIPAQAERVIPT